MEERSPEPARQLQRLREEVAGLRQLRRHLLERLTNLDENITFKQRLIEALEVDLPEIKSDAAPLDGPRYGGLRNAVLERLADEPGGMTGVEIGRMLGVRFGDTINRRSHHAVLRRLEQDGLLEREGRNWRLKP